MVSNASLLLEKIEISQVSGYYIDFTTFEFPCIIIETSKPLPSFHTSLSTMAHEDKQYALLSPHTSFLNVWAKMNVGLSGYLLNLPISIKNTKSDCTLFSFYRKRESTCHQIPQIHSFIDDGSFLVGKSFYDKLNGRFVSTAPQKIPSRNYILIDELEYLSPCQSFVRPSLTAQVQGYMRLLITDLRFRYFAGEKALLQIEKLFQTFFQESFFSLVVFCFPLSFKIIRNAIASAKYKYQSTIHAQMLAIHSKDEHPRKKHKKDKNAAQDFHMSLKSGVKNWGQTLPDAGLANEYRPSRCKYEISYPENNATIVCYYNRMPLFSWSCVTCGFLNVVSSELSLRALSNPDCCFYCRNNVYGMAL